MHIRISVHQWVVTACMALALLSFMCWTSHEQSVNTQHCGGVNVWFDIKSSAPEGPNKPSQWWAQNSQFGLAESVAASVCVCVWWSWGELCNLHDSGKVIHVLHTSTKTGGRWNSNTTEWISWQRLAISYFFMSSLLLVKSQIVVFFKAMPLKDAIVSGYLICSKGRATIRSKS